MNKRLTLTLFIIIVAITLIAGAVAYPRLPERPASHWNAAGQADGTTTPLGAVLTLPAILFFTGMLMFAIPSIDPLKKNIAEFRPQYNTLIIGMSLFLLYLHLLTLAWNLNVEFDFNRMLAPAFGLLMIMVGGLLANAKRNYMVGIRTPWTLANDVVWQKTHRQGAWAFRIAGFIALLGIFWPQQAFWLLFIPIMAAALYTVLYSFFAFQAESRKG